MPHGTTSVPQDDRRTVAPGDRFGILRLAAATIILIIWHPLFGQQTATDRDALYRSAVELSRRVGGTVNPHWMTDGSSFWYAERTGAETLIWKVDPAANSREPFFDVPRLREALKKETGLEPAGSGLPFFRNFELDEDEGQVRFSIDEEEFWLDLDSYSLGRTTAAVLHARALRQPEVIRRRLNRPNVRELPSPDGTWLATVKDHNIWLRPAENDEPVPLTSDGAETRPWRLNLSLWSPSGDKLIAAKVDYSDVPRVPVVDWLDPTAKVDWHWGIRLPAETPKPTSELFVLDVSSKEVTALDIRRSPGQTFDVLGWKGDGEDLWLLQMSADYRRLDLLRADPESGSTKVVLTERSNTFIGGYFWWYERIHFLEGGRRFIWQSERDGWNHLYLYDAGLVV